MSGLPDATGVTCSSCRNFAWTSTMRAAVVDGQKHHPSCPEVKHFKTGPLLLQFGRWLPWPGRRR